MALLLTIPVRVCAQTQTTLTLQAIDSIKDCPQCAEGKGCGQNPWFRGIIGQHRFQIPRPEHLPQALEFLELHLSSAVLTQLSMALYGLPLLSFFITLWLSQHFMPWLQFLLALLALSTTVVLGKNWRNRCLQRYLQVSIPPANHATYEAPSRYSP